MEIVIILINNGVNLFIEDNHRKMAVDYLIREDKEANYKMMQLVLERMKTEEVEYLERLKLQKLIVH